MARIRSKSFWSKYQERYRKHNTLVCIGLDSDWMELPACVRSDHNPIFTFNKAIIEATAEYAAAYKPNLAFYLAAGVKGLEALKLTVEAVPTEIPVIIDCKVGDIGNTMMGYVTAFFDEMGADAITVNPLMGVDVLKPVLQDEKNFCFALALTSNPSAQDFLLKSGLSTEIAAWLKGFNKKQVGAVVGATHAGHLKEMRNLLPEQVFLIPGVGAQGGDLRAVLANTVTSKNEPNIVVNSSRGIIFKDKTESFAEKAGEEARLLRNAIRDGLV